MTDLLGATQPVTNPRTGGARRWTPLLLTHLVAVLAVLLAGVGSAVALQDDDSGTDALSVVRAASTTALRAGTLRMTFEMNIKGSGSPISARGEFLLDVAGKRGSGSMSFPVVGDIEFAQVGQQAFIHLPGGKADSAGHHWIAVTVPESDAASAFGGPDPLSYLKLLATPEGVTEEGHQTINGTSTTHYKVRLDPDQVLAQAGKQLGSTLPPGALDQVKDLFMNAWIDDDNQPRRMSMTMTIQKMQTEMVFDFLDYGKPVNVTTPPAGDVTTVGSISELGPALSGVYQS